MKTPTFENLLTALNYFQTPIQSNEIIYSYLQINENEGVVIHSDGNADIIALNEDLDQPQ